MLKLIAGLLLFVATQTAFWHETNRIYPDMSVVPDVPGRQAIEAISFGDAQSLFRFYGLTIQNAGDTFGRFTSLRDYDYNKLYHWFGLLDVMDKESDFTPTMASYYFGNTPKVEDLQYIVDYLLEHVDGRVQQKWWWVTQAVYLSNHRLEDKEQALKIANMLQNQPGIPFWAQQMPAFIYEQQGEFEMAAKIIDNILQEAESIPPHELRFMEYFVQERLSALDEVVKKSAGENDESRKPEAP
ncbi:MAG: hypothetical protein MRY32_02975 [Rickettsiales bacterium]|nr:hypothetical protein [Rickettsiales bacterium]